MTGCECCIDGEYETECLSCNRKICNQCWGLCSTCKIKTCKKCKKKYGITHYRCKIHQYDYKR